MNIEIIIGVGIGVAAALMLLTGIVLGLRMGRMLGRANALGWQEGFFGRIDWERARRNMNGTFKKKGGNHNG